MRAWCSVFAILACSPDSQGGEVGEDVVPGTVAPGFWDHWGDGRAEVSADRLETPRYGQSREGRVTLVFVTEPFDDVQRVKPDGGREAYQVLKVNEIRDFQTGIYDYNVMTSTFLRLDGAAPWGEPVKVSMTMQEWCGHVYEHVLPREDGLHWTQHSYFDGEADRQLDLGRRPSGVLADALPALVRGLLEPEVEPGTARTVDGLSTLVSGRLAHRTPRWSELTLRVADDTHPMTTPAGTFEVRDTTTRHDGVTTTWHVEVAEPRRIVGWERSDGEVAELVGTDRLAYWQRNREGDERALQSLGLPAPRFVGGD